MLRRLLPDLRFLFFFFLLSSRFLFDPVLFVPFSVVAFPEEFKLNFFFVDFRVSLELRFILAEFRDLLELRVLLEFVEDLRDPLRLRLALWDELLLPFRDRLEL